MNSEWLGHETLTLPSLLSFTGGDVKDLQSILVGQTNLLSPWHSLKQRKYLINKSKKNHTNH